MHLPADQFAPGQRLLDGRQMCIGLRFWRDELDQHIQHTAARQGPRWHKAAVAIANHLIDRLELPRGNALEKILFHATTRQRAAMLTAAQRHQHRTRPAWGRAECGKNRAQPDGLAAGQPVTRLLYYLQIKLFHCYNPAISFSLLIGRLRTRLPVA